MPIGKVWIYYLLFVFIVGLFVRLLYQTFAFIIKLSQMQALLQYRKLFFTDSPHKK